MRRKRCGVVWEIWNYWISGNRRLATRWITSPAITASSSTDQKPSIFRTTRASSVIRDVAIPASNQLPSHCLDSCDAGNLEMDTLSPSIFSPSILFRNRERCNSSKAMTRGVPNRFSCTTNLVLLALLLASACFALPTLNVSQSSFMPSSNSNELGTIIPHCRLHPWFIPPPLFCPHQISQEILDEHRPSIL